MGKFRDEAFYQWGIILLQFTLLWNAALSIAEDDTCTTVLLDKTSDECQTIFVRLASQFTVWFSYCEQSIMTAGLVCEHLFVVGICYIHMFRSAHFDWCRRRYLHAESKRVARKFNGTCKSALLSVCCSVTSFIIVRS